MGHSIKRYHDISCGHRVTGHESKCRHLHGHNYRIHFTLQSKSDLCDLDRLGRVIDFSVVKATVCEWLEQNWDHKFLAWDQDPIMQAFQNALSFAQGAFPDAKNWPEGEADKEFKDSVVWTPFNPTAENMAAYLVDTIGPQLLDEEGVELLSVTIEETAKCSATYTLD